MKLQSAGFGFIRPSSGQVGGSDLYFHAKECDRDSPFDELREGDKVAYQVAQDDRNGKMMAVNVRMLGGGKSKRRDDSRGRGGGGGRRGRDDSRRRR